MDPEQIMSFPGGYQVGQAAPMPIFGNSPLSVRPLSDKGKSDDSLKGLDAYIRKALSGGMGGDDTELGPTSFDVYNYLRNQGRQGPAPEDIEAGKAHVSARSAKDLADRLNAIPTPQRELLSQPNLPALSLPNTPQRQQAQMNPLASLAAGLFGVVSPESAGQFGAAALHGALEKNQRDYEDAQQEYQQDYQQSIALHADALRRENARNEIENENKNIGYQNSVAKSAGDKEAAVLSNNASRLEGTDEFLQRIAGQARPARQAESQAEDVLARMKMEQQAKQKAKEEQNVTLGHVLGAYSHIKAAGIGYDKTLDQQYVRNEQQEKNLTARHNDVVYRADKALEAARVRAGAMGGRALADPTMNLRMRSLQEKVRTERIRYDLLFKSSDPTKNYGNPRTPQQESDLHFQDQKIEDATKDMLDFTASIVTNPANRPRKYNAPGLKSGAYKSPGGISFTVK